MKSTIIKFIFLFTLTLFSQISFSKSLQVNKFISYTDVGNGTPLILIHPFPTDHRLWEPQREGFKAYFRVITLDLWGFGQSATVDGKAVTMSDFADEVKQLMDQLHIQKAIIGGESMGGYVALQFLQNYPERVNGLILSDTQSIADSEEAKTKRELSAQEVLSHGTDQLINGFMPKALTKDAPVTLQRFLKNILEAQSPNAVASALRGMALRHDTSELLSTTDLPILIITGKEDTLVSPSQSEAMHKYAKNSKLVVIDHAAHLSSLEQSDMWNKAVINLFYI